jgi:hypothetical protein
MRLTITGEIAAKGESDHMRWLKFFRASVNRATSVQVLAPCTLGVRIAGFKSVKPTTPVSCPIGNGS